LSFGANIKKYRDLLGMSQKALAEKIGVFAQTIGRWEREEQTPNALDLKRIAEALNTTTVVLLEENLENIAADPRFSEQASNDFNSILDDLLKERPDLRLAFRHTRENWGQMGDTEKKALADILMYIFGKNTLEESGLRTRGKRGAI
jgi:transcriptional regulator with XRE-family HTH domain